MGLKELYILDNAINVLYKNAINVHQKTHAKVVIQLMEQYINQILLKIIVLHVIFHIVSAVNKQIHVHNVL